MANARVQSELVSAALKGAVAGMLGGVAMKAVMEMEQTALLPEGQRMTPPPKKIVQKVEKQQEIELSRQQEQMAAMGVHLGYSAAWGAVHGMGSKLLDLPPTLHGLLLGGIVYWSSMGPKGFLTRMGVTSSPLLQPLSQAAIPVGAHVAYGLATAAVYEALD
jgi:hypothetical protein